MEEEFSEQSSTIEGEGIPDPQADPVAEEERGQMTLQERVRADADFAWEQIRSRDARVSELANRVKQYEAIDPYLKAAGGPDGLLELATYGNQVRSVPGMDEFVQRSIKEGRIALPETTQQDDPADEWMDEDTKRVRDETRRELSQLKQELAELKQIAGSASVRSQEVHVQRNLEDAMSIFKDHPDIVSEATELVSSRIMGAQRLAEGGDTRQQQLINQLAGPEGKDVIEFMLMPLIKKHGSKLFSGNTSQTNGNGNAAVVRATDERTVNSSRPGAPPLPPVPKGSGSDPSYALKILRDIGRRNGRSV